MNKYFKCVFTYCPYAYCHNFPVLVSYLNSLMHLVMKPGPIIMMELRSLTLDSLTSDPGSTFSHIPLFIQQVNLLSICSRGLQTPLIRSTVDLPGLPLTLNTNSADSFLFSVLRPVALSLGP